MSVSDMSKCTVVATVGLPMAGKSTWSKRVSEKFGIPVVSMDAVRMALHGKVFVESEEGRAWDMGRRMVHALFLAGHKVVIVDECNMSRGERGNWKSIKWITLWKVFDTAADVCVMRAYATKEEFLEPVIARKDAESEPLMDSELIFGSFMCCEPDCVVAKGARGIREVKGGWRNTGDTL